MSNFTDPFGFNKHTATILRGLGASEIIPQCQKRNISTDVLHQLSVEELIILGTDPEKAEELHKALKISNTKSNIVNTNPEDRIKQYLEIIKHSKEQLSLLKAYIIYCRLRMANEKIDMFVDPNKCLTASKILPIAIDATLTEIEETKRNIAELQQLILEHTTKPKLNNIRQTIFISGVGLVVIALFVAYIR